MTCMAYTPATPPARLLQCLGLHAGLKTYPNYMMGGGYVVSGDVAASLVNINRKMKLKVSASAVMLMSV